MGDFSLFSDGQDYSPQGLAVGIAIGGTVLTAASSANIKGSWAEVSSSTPFDATSFFLSLCAPNGLTNDECLLDIGIGASGQEVVIVPDLLLSPTGASWSPGLDEFLIPIPLSVPAGTRLSARLQQSVAGGYGSGQISLDIKLLAGGWGASSPLQVASSIGVSTINTTGTVVAASTSSGTYGSWVELTSATDGPICSLLVLLGGQQQNTGMGYYIDLAVGSSGNEQKFLYNLVAYRDGSSSRLNPRVHGPFPVNIPAGTRISARLLDNGGGSRTLEVACYGFSP